MQIIAVMAESTRISGINVERTVKQILNAMEDDDEEIYRETENSNSNFSDEDYQIIKPPSLESHYSDTEAVISCLTDSESESEDEDEDFFNALPTTSTDSSATPGFSLTQILEREKMELSGVRFCLRRVELDRTTLSTQGYTEFLHQTFTLQKILFRSFLVKTSLKKFCCVQTCRVDG